MDTSTEKYAQQQDAQDLLRHLRDQFIIPTKADLNRNKLHRNEDEGSEHAQQSIYLCGNSLGLQPKVTRIYMQQYLDTWATKGVFGHFKEVEDSRLVPWLSAGDYVLGDMAQIIGARPEEVAVMQTLTANLHLMMASFYRPTKDRWKIILEGKAFPSDHVCCQECSLTRVPPAEIAKVRCRVTDSPPWPGPDRLDGSD